MERIDYGKEHRIYKMTDDSSKQVAGSGYRSWFSICSQCYYNINRKVSLYHLAC